MNNFTFYCPTKFLFGKDTEQRAGALCRACGASHVLLVYGGASAQKSGLLSRIQNALAEEGLQVKIHWHSAAVRPRCCQKPPSSRQW